jgi:hypothetical protein
MSDINGVYRVCNKREDKSGKVFWDDIGLRVFIGEWEGKPSVSVFDARLGAKYPAFKIEKQDHGSPDRNQSATSGPREVPPPSENDCPF